MKHNTRAMMAMMALYSLGACLAPQEPWTDPRAQRPKKSDEEQGALIAAAKGKRAKKAAKRLRQANLKK